MGMTVRCDLAGKVVAVTGASRGLGAVAARAFAQAGAQVALLGRTEQDLEEQAAYIGSSALPIVADVGHPEDVRRAFALIDEKFGRLDVLVNNAATMAHALIHEATDEDISSIVGSNFLGPIYTTRAAIPAMRRVGSGHILNISTEGTMFPEAPYLGLYVATKTGLDMFSRVSYEELKPLGIRVTLIVPGAMQPRDPGPELAARPGTDPQRVAKIVNALEVSGHLALLRDGNRAYCEDVVDAMLFAISAPHSCAIDVIRVRPFPEVPVEEPLADTTALSVSS